VTAPPRGRPLILHVEDNDAQRDVLKIILEGNGFAVLQAQTAEEALRMCRETPVSLIVADHMLAGTTGAELAANIKLFKPTVPIVLHSGTPPVSMRNLDGFIQKGESVRNLVEFLRVLLNRFWE
jgi:two-component system, OmpR family, phosphate regulon response regulator PhoB